MWAGKVFKLVVRPLSALSLVVPMLGVLMMVTAPVLRRRLAAHKVKNGGCASGQTRSSCPV